MKAKLKIIKIGGHVIDDQSQLDQFLKDFAQLEGPKILVHGGGKIATEICQSIGVQTQMIDGRRVTTEKDLEVVTMVYAGLINKGIVAKLQADDCSSLGLSGADSNTIVSKRRAVAPIDFGFVGDIVHINHDLIHELLQLHLSLVFCAITHDGNGQLLNTNADTIASEIAIGMSQLYETELIYCFEKKGVLDRLEDENSVISCIDETDYQTLKKEKKIHSGMLPKLDNCYHALRHQVSKVLIGSPSVISDEGGIYTSLVLSNDKIH